MLTDALANERGFIGGGIVLKVAHASTCSAATSAIADATAGRCAHDPAGARPRSATLAAEIEVGRRMMVHCAELVDQRHDAARDGRDQQGFFRRADGALRRDRARYPRAAAALSQGAPGALRDGRYEQGLRHSLMWVISIGTNEIQRSLIAQRGLGLPR